MRSAASDFSARTSSLIGGDARLGECVAQRAEVTLVIPPAARRPGVEGLSHLPYAGRFDGAVSLREVQQRVFPLEVEEFGDLLHHRFRFANQHVVIDLADIRAI